MTAIAARPTSVRWRIVLLLMALCFISHFNRISMAVAGDERIMNDYGIRPNEMGRVYFAFLLVYTIFMTAGGFFIDRFGVRKALAAVAVGSGFFAALTGLLGLAFTLATQFLVTLAIVRSAMGLVTTPLHPACANAVSHWIPSNQRSSANGLITGAALFGVAFTYPLFGRMIDWFDWPLAFVIAGVATILLGVIWAWYAADTPRQHPGTNEAERQLVSASPPDSAQTQSRGWLSLLTNPSLLWLTLGYAAIGYFQYLFFYWIHYYFESIRHFGKEQSRWYAAIPVITMGICMPLGGWVSDQMERRYGHAIGRKIVPMGSMLMSAALLGLGLMTESAAAMVFWFSLSLGAVGAAEGPFWLTAVELGGRRGGSAAAVINTGGNGIGLLAPLLTPMISESLGWKWGISIGGLVCIVGGLCWWPIRIPKPATQTRSTTEYA